jgi:glycosyltransferase involved in cell wall biosynthesis
LLRRRLVGRFGAFGVRASFGMRHSVATQPRARVIMLSPDPVHPGGVTRVIDTWVKGGLKNHVDVKHIYAAAWDAPLVVQILQTARAYLALTLTLLRSRRKSMLLHIHVSTGGSLYREWIALRLAQLFRVPVVSHLHSGNFGRWVAGRPARRWFARGLFAQSRVVVVPARPWIELVRELGARQVRVVPHGLGDQLASELEAVADHGTHHKQFERSIVLYYGRWTPIKGLDILGEAVRGLDGGSRSRLSLRIFGNGNREWLERCLDDLAGAEIHIGGWLSDEDKAGELRMADAFVLPSRSELFGQALLEAMAAGRPVIATLVGGIPDVLDDYAGARLIPPESPRALQNALEDLLDGVWPKPDQRGATPLSARFAAPNVVAQLLDVYQTAERNASFAPND